MNEEKINYLLHSLDNENNTSIMKLNSKIISQQKNDNLQKLNQSRETLKMFNTKLKDYRFIDELPDLQYGSYIRWINLNNHNNIKLTNGGHLLEIKILENGIHLLLKNNSWKIMQIKFDECFIFQKLTNQEKIILSALNFLDK
jgi:hypothetical protein